MTTASPTQLALQLDQYHAALVGADATLRTLIHELSIGDANAAEHAEERLAFVVDALRGTVRSLEYLKRYTTTGARRLHQQGA